jgi:ferrochelatase
MRYWHPLTDVAVEKLSSDHVRKVVLLPLYPQYSVATSGSSFHEWERSVARNGLKDLEVSLVEEYCDHPLYIAALVRNITLALQRVPTAERSRIHLVFSAHGTPIKLVKRGDPYEAQIIRTVNAVVKAGKFGLPHVLCYQSKVGPQRWLEPSLDDTIKKLAAEKTTHLLVVPIAFVSDHIETLWEINIESREEARNLGIQYFDVVPALNSSPLFIEALADIVRKKVTRS